MVNIIQNGGNVADKRFMELVQQMADIHVRKNAGYAGMDNPDAWANFRMSEWFGVSALRGCLIRMSDKFIRVSNLTKNPNNDQVNENIKDTLIDLANYALIAICLLEEEEKKKECVGNDEQTYLLEFDTSEKAIKLKKKLKGSNKSV